MTQFVWPYPLGLTPGGLPEYPQVPGMGGGWTAVSIGNILPFASSTLILFYAVSRFRAYPYIAETLAKDPLIVLTARAA
jgi:hypothetical protein